MSRILHELLPIWFLFYTTLSSLLEKLLRYSYPIFGSTPILFIHVDVFFSCFCFPCHNMLPPSFLWNYMHYLSFEKDLLMVMSNRSKWHNILCNKTIRHLPSELRYQRHPQIMGLMWVIEVHNWPRENKCNSQQALAHLALPPYKCYVEDEVIGSKPIRCDFFFPIKKKGTEGSKIQHPTCPFYFFSCQSTTLLWA